MQAEEFKGYCRAQLTLGFQHILAGKYDEKHKYRTEGLLQAARMLGIMSTEEVTGMIEQTHFEVFGETVAARKARKDSLAQLKDSAPDEYYDIPAIYRKS